MKEEQSFRSEVNGLLPLSRQRSATPFDLCKLVIRFALTAAHYSQQKDCFMPGKCSQCGSRTYLGRTTIQTDLVAIQNIPCTVCRECGHEQIAQLVQKKIDKLLERSAKGKLKSRVIVM
jgi:type II secretory ATPase GspE/PulE/Tfp pilus assembly ATPase PilB-like protein